MRITVPNTAVMRTPPKNPPSVPQPTAQYLLLELESLSAEIGRDRHRVSVHYKVTDKVEVTYDMDRCNKRTLFC